MLSFCCASLSCVCSVVSWTSPCSGTLFLPDRNDEVAIPVTRREVTTLLSCGQDMWPPGSHPRRYSPYLQHHATARFSSHDSSLSLTEGVSRKVKGLAGELPFVRKQHKWRQGILHNCKNNFLTSWLTENVEVLFPLESSGELKSN